MTLRFFLPLLLLVSLAPARLGAQDMYSDQVYVVLVGINSSKDAALCYTERFDKKKVRITYQFEDTINYLSDFAYEEEEMYGPDCFIPELKLVFRDYTYVLSLYCARAIKYKNSSPFRPSATRMPNDLAFTHSVYEFLDKLRRKYFGSMVDSHAAEQLVTNDPLMEMPDEEFEDLLFEDEFDEFDEFDLEDDEFFFDDEEDADKYPFEEDDSLDEDDPDFDDR